MRYPKYVQSPAATRSAAERARPALRLATLARSALADCAGCPAARRPCSTAASAPSTTSATPPSHFAVLGVREAFDLSPAELSAAHRRLQREWHPDRFAQADERARRRAAEVSARVNDAYAALKAPESRARHLLAVRTPRDDGTAADSTQLLHSDDDDVSVDVDVGLLAWVVQAREKIELASRVQDIEDMQREAEDLIDTCCRNLSIAFGNHRTHSNDPGENNSTNGAGLTTTDLDRARSETVRLQYLYRIFSAAGDRIHEFQQASE